MHLNSTNLSTGGEDDALLSFPKAWWQSSSHYWDSHVSNKSNKVLATLEKSRMKRW